MAFSLDSGVFGESGGQVWEGRDEGSPPMIPLDMVAECLGSPFIVQ